MRLVGRTARYKFIQWDYHLLWRAKGPAVLVKVIDRWQGAVDRP